MRGNPPKGGKKGQEVAGTLGGGSGSRGWSSDLDRTTFIPVEVDASRVNGAVSRKWSKGSGSPAEGEAYNFVSGAWWDGGQLGQTLDSVIAKQQMMPEKNRFPVVLQTAIAVRTAQTGANGIGVAEDVAHTLDGAQGQAVAFTASEQSNGFAWERPHYPTLTAGAPTDSSNIQHGIRIGTVVRRLTPRECERLQGLPDDWTLVPYRGKPAADSPRYKAIGNGMAVPVVKWIGQRLLEAMATQWS